MSAGRVSECIKSPAKLFTPTATSGSPPADGLTDERVAEVVYLDGATELTHDARGEFIPATAPRAKSGLAAPSPAEGPPLMRCSPALCQRSFARGAPVLVRLGSLFFQALLI